MSVQYEQFGKYILLERLATGGMAEVFLARGSGAGGIGKFFAIKRILPQFADNPEFIEMFKEEAKIAINLSHSNIVSIHEFGVEKGQFFLVMDFVEGRNLRQILNKMKKTSPQFTIERIVYIIKEVAAGLDHAHRCINGSTGKPLNIIHRDMSPQNIMISFEGEVKIVDFGIAKAESKLENTRAGTLKGKFGYMSPEQADGMAVDLRTDIFSLGIVLWELLANDRLFVANSEMNIIRKVRDCQIPSLRKINPSIHAELERIVHKALARDRNLRYQTSAALHRDLNRFLNRQFPDFSSQDFATSIKSIFTEEIIALRKNMVTYAQVNLSISLNLPIREAATLPVDQDALMRLIDEDTQVEGDATALFNADTSSLVQSQSGINSIGSNTNSNLRIGAEDTKPNAQLAEPPATPAPDSAPTLQAPILQPVKPSSLPDKTEQVAPPTSTLGIETGPQPIQQKARRSLLDDDALAAAATFEHSVSQPPMIPTQTSPSISIPENVIAAETEAIPQVIIPDRRAPSRAAPSRTNITAPLQPTSSLGTHAATFFVFLLACVSAYAFMVKNHQASMLNVIRMTDPALHKLHVALGADLNVIDHPAPPVITPPPEPEVPRTPATPSSPPSTSAGLVVTTTPSGAEIFLNGKPTGVVTPARVLVPQDDNFSIVLRKRGYAEFKRADVSRAVLGHRLEVNLQKLNVGTLDIEIFPPQEATLYVNGKVTDTSSYLARQILVPGNTPVTVRAESANGLTFDEFTVTVPTDQKRSVKINPRRQARKPANSQ